MRPKVEKAFPKLKKSHISIALVNKKTDRISSTNSVSNVRAVQAFLNGETLGLPGLMAIKGQKIAQKNKLSKRPSRISPGKKFNNKAREQAKNFIVVLAVLYAEVLPKHRPPRRKDFVIWVTRQMANPNSEAYLRASNLGLDELIARKRSSRWWQDQLKKMQS